MANSPSNFSGVPAPATWGHELITTNETSSNTSFVDLATVGPTVTLVTGTKVIIYLSMSGYRPSGSIQTQYMGIRVTDALGTEIVAADLNLCIAAASRGSGVVNSMSGCVQMTGLPPGKKTFTAKYRVDGSTFNFYDRAMLVMVL